MLKNIVLLIVVVTRKKPEKFEKYLRPCKLIDKNMSQVFNFEVLNYNTTFEIIFRNAGLFQAWESEGIGSCESGIFKRSQKAMLK